MKLFIDTAMTEETAAIPFNMMEQMFCRELTGNGLEIFCNAAK